MKKAIALTALLLFAAVPAFAASPASSGSAGLSIKAGNGDVIAKLSSNVRAVVYYGTTSYALATKSDKGSKLYGTAADDTGIYSRDGDANTPLSTSNDELNSKSDSTAFGSGTGWSEM